MSKYVPPHLRVAGGGGGGVGAGGGAGLGGGGLEGAAAVVNNLLRARAAEDAEVAGSVGGGPGAPASGGEVGGGGGGEGKGAWGAWSRGSAPLRSTRAKPQQRNTALKAVEVDSLVVMKILKHWR